MIIDQHNGTFQVEPRDINFFLQAYIRQYEFQTKNAGLKEIIFPMYSNVKHPMTGAIIPIQFLPEFSPQAMAIKEDGSNVPEVTPEQEAKLDARDEEIKNLKRQIEDLSTEFEDILGKQRAEMLQMAVEHRADEMKEAKLLSTYEEEKPSNPFESVEEEPTESAAFNIDPDPTHAPPEGRIPKSAGPEASGGPDGMHPRLASDLRSTRKALMDEPDVDDNAEKPYEKKVTKDSDGNPVVED